MDYKYPITILTPVFNRADLLARLFSSLLRQSYQNFQWLIIDDGSQDNIEQVVDSFSEYGFEIDYQRKDNGGKHTALNYSHPYIKGSLLCIVDSDDYLIDDAIRIIIEAYEKYKNNESIKVISFLKGRSISEPLTKSFPETDTISNHIDFRHNEKRVGDCCEVIYSDIFKKFSFPEHTGEKFMGEGYLWNNVGFRYNTVYINKIIYIADYLEGGLSRQGKKLRIMCPLGGMDNCNSFFITETDRSLLRSICIKEAVLFVCYGKFAGFSKHDIINRCYDKKMARRVFFIGHLLYLYWKKKYAI